MSLLYMLEKYQQYSGNTLISPYDLEKISKDTSLYRIIEIRNKDSYNEGHIKNSVSITRKQLESSHGKVTGMAGDRLQIQNLLSDLGCTPSTHLVLLDERGNYDSCRFWWLLKIYGHEKISIVDGGINSYKLLDLPTINEKSQIACSSYTFSQNSNDEDLAYLYHITAKEYDELLDVRSQEEFTGEIQQVGAFAAGRIPNAKFFPYDQMLYEKSQGLGFKTKSELEALVQKAGLNCSKKYITYCQSGVRSAHSLFVLKELLGFSDVKNYDGSWIEYSATKLPIERN